MKSANRRDFLSAMAAGSFGLALSREGEGAGGSEGRQLGVSTHVYKTVDGCAIRADVYRADPGKRGPALMWIHGGALILGSRSGVDRRLLSELRRLGFVVVSIDYRLAPESKLPQIIEDVRDAWRWLRKEGPDRFGVDPDRIATAGGSAGGYLTLMTGFCLEPRPRALVSYYGYGDITTPWYAEPDAFYRRQPLVPKEEAYAAVGKNPLSEPPKPNQRGLFYLYCRQNGLWPAEVAGHDPHQEPAWFDSYCPIRNVTAKYPPTLLIHGTEDTDVPYSESENMAARLKRTGVECELTTVPGAGHGLSGARPELVADIARRAAEFVQAHTK